MNGKMFTDVYFVRDGNRQAFLKAPRLLTSRIYKPENEYDIFVPGAKNKIISYDDDGITVPSIVTRIRFMKAISKVEDDEHVFTLLNQILKEVAIKELFPEVWQAHEQYCNKKALNRYVHEQKRLRKDPVHREAAQRLRNGGVRKFLKEDLI